MSKPAPLPNVRQRKAYDCGTAAWRCLWKHHKGRDSRVVDLANRVQGTDPSTLEAVIRVEPKWQVIAGNMTLAELKHYPETGRPVIALVTYPGELEDAHYCLVNGVWRGRVWYHDVSDGWQSLAIPDWEAIWTGVGRYIVFHRWGLVAWPEKR